MNDLGVAITLDGLGVSFGDGANRVQALKGLSCSIRRGGITGLMGPDAAGKTTFMRVLTGLIPASEGKVSVFGMDPAVLSASDPNCIGYMPQRFGLYEDLSVQDNLELYASLHGVEGSRRQELFRKLLSFTSLKPFTARLAGNLSGGMKQKLGIACALLGDPRLLLLDEPGVGVDPQSRRELWRMVQSLSGDGMTVIWSTSYLDEAARCPYLIMLNAGSILFDGRPEELTKRVAGRSFLLGVSTSADGQSHREALAYWTQRPGIIDASIQGRFLRLVIAKNDENAEEEILGKGGKLVEPRLEDAYMAEVGGMDKRPSPYAGMKNIGNPADRHARIEADHLTKKFGSFTAAHNITFKVGAGEIVGLLGPNGAGKSTTFRMLCGLLRPTSGACSVDGVDMLKSGSAARERLGYMAQKFSLYPEIKVGQNISIFANLYGLDKQRKATFLPSLANALDLNPYLKKVTETLPLGLKQRLALLCATMHEPPTLFLDEPTSGVDVRTRRDFWKHISALTQAGCAVLVTTHFMEEAEYCDRIALIYRGNMISFGSPDQLKAQVKDAPNPTMEDAFIECIERYDKDHPL